MATMGVCCSGEKLCVLDDVTSWDTCMAASIVNAKLINPAIDIQGLENNVSTQVGEDEFWKSLSVVINSLNMSVHERLKIDWKSFYYRKPMMNLSTFLDNCNTKIIIPCVTDEYGISEASNSPQFLREIKDCFRWAFSEFQILFEKTPAEAKAYYSAPNKYIDGMMKANVVET
ncbi:hypothetical protein C2S52_013586 [Perilla frutescens var. hirtella]|nr:hypothetical protein C2S51_015871 [Perilla frutescens var. frutescens]KAH6776025.1 hypothetical protein C2S52_013586 [Perilla frutescens var. hirtella]